MTLNNRTPVDFLIDSIELSRHNNTDQCAVGFPCSICHYDVKHNDKSIFCTTCDKWVHIKCNGITLEVYRAMQKLNRDNPELIDEKWECLSCIGNK